MDEILIGDNMSVETADKRQTSIKTLDGVALDYFVGKAIGLNNVTITSAQKECFASIPMMGVDNVTTWMKFAPSKRWFQGGPIVEDYQINICAMGKIGEDPDDLWGSYIGEESMDKNRTTAYAYSPLEAAMKSFLLFKTESDYVDTTAIDIIL